MEPGVLTPVHGASSNIGDRVGGKEREGLTGSAHDQKHLPFLLLSFPASMNGTRAIKLILELFWKRFVGHFYLDQQPLYFVPDNG